MKYQMGKYLDGILKLMIKKMKQSNDRSPQLSVDQQMNRIFQLPFLPGNAHQNSLISRFRFIPQQLHKMGISTSQRSLHLTLALATLFITIPFATSASAQPSAYELLETFNFPKGLLPQGVIDYTLDNSTGKFSASFNGSCGFSLEGSYQLKYKSTIRGSLTNGKLSNLQGVSVKILFFWTDIVKVYRSGDSLEFSVGIAFASFPVDNFEESPRCGCGLDCVDGAKRRFRISRSPF